MHSVPYYCGILLEINIKIYLKITLIFSNAMWCFPREISDLATGNLSKLDDWKNRGWLLRKKQFKWEINIKLSKISRWIDRKVEGYGRPEKQYEPIQHN